MSTRAAAEWTQRPERGSLPVVRFMAWLSVAIGRGASRVLLRFIVLYFFVTGGAARRHSAEFLQRALGFSRPRRFVRPVASAASALRRAAWARPA